MADARVLMLASDENTGGCEYKEQEVFYFELTHMKMSWIQHKSKKLGHGFPSYSVAAPPLSLPSLLSMVHGQISPSLPPPSLRASSSGPKGQLRQLFHMHDSGLDQAFIDALPVFLFKEIMGDKEPLDCAVCLCEFLEKDKLRLLPLCGHAFHISCIDTWLLSSSTCPLCRGPLFSSGFPTDNPMFELDELRDEDGCSQIGENRCSSGEKVIEVEEHVGNIGLFPVRLGKFWNSNDSSEAAMEQETSSSNLDARRCYSMGSYQYVVRPNNLRVALCPDSTSLNIRLVKDVGHNGDTPVVEGSEEEKNIGIMSKRDSYSISKIWLWPKARNIAGSSAAGADALPWMDRTANSCCPNTYGRQRLKRVVDGIGMVWWSGVVGSREGWWSAEWGEEKGKKKEGNGRACQDSRYKATMYIYFMKKKLIGGLTAGGLVGLHQI
ncbi:RING-H2 finger protein ATL46-like protein [Drosera capensis]